MQLHEIFLIPFEIIEIFLITFEVTLIAFEIVYFSTYWRSWTKHASIGFTVMECCRTILSSRQWLDILFPNP